MTIKPAFAGVLSLALCGAATLGGCVNPSSVTRSTTSSTTDAFNLEVQNLALAACAFEPSADAIAKIWLANSSADVTQDASNADATA